MDIVEGGVNVGDLRTEIGRIAKKWYFEKTGS